MACRGSRSIRTYAFSVTVNALASAGYFPERDKWGGKIGITTAYWQLGRNPGVNN